MYVVISIMGVVHPSYVPSPTEMEVLEKKMSNPKAVSRSLPNIILYLHSEESFIWYCCVITFVTLNFDRQKSTLIFWLVIQFLDCFSHYMDTFSYFCDFMSCLQWLFCSYIQYIVVFRRFCTSLYLCMYSCVHVEWERNDDLFLLHVSRSKHSVEWIEFRFFICVFRLYLYIVFVCYTLIIQHSHLM